ncbi:MULTISPECIES: helix-turn-helix domain-containing protein [Staphylococcus]|uniref:helix-turn-helix domain-containing protein n=1 Tax=Staphylococcus TaxID=1279 RepID=UPI001AEBDF5C|nr:MULTISPECIES: helix-turn-helix transcriptional regulator [unclassified Staphylococcus]HAP2020806.1 helix-turn-helix transcriptional regulator [Escherichia coli]
MNLSLKKDTRSYFLDDQVRQGLIEYEDLSVKTLTNIENGYNLPSLSTLKILSTALEIDFFQLLAEVYDYIPRQ